LKRAKRCEAKSAKVFNVFYAKLPVKTLLFNLTGINPN
jgi:hypothetical protein